MTPAAATSDRPHVFHLVTQVWGEAFCDALTSICIPALLSPGNIPALAADWPCRFIVYTREEDIERITGTSAFERLRSHVPVEFRTVDAELQVDKYSAMSRIHYRVLGAAAFDHAAIVWLVPDAVWSDGSLRTVSRAAAAGKRAVMQPAIRVVKETALPALRVLAQDPAKTCFTAGQLVSIAMQHMHEYYRACFWDAPSFNRNPALTFWRVGDEGAVARGFHLHPLMLFPTRLAGSSFVTFDDELPLTACPNYDDFHIIQNSDDGFHIDLTEADWCPFIPMLSGRPSATFFAWWALNGANLHHRRFFNHPIRLHIGAMSPAWQTVEQETERFAAKVRLIVALCGVLRLPFELLFGQRRSVFLRGHYEPPRRTRGTNRFSRAYDRTRLQAYLFAYGWVFGYRAALRRIGVTSWYDRALTAYYALQREIATRRLAMINYAALWRRRKKKIKSVVRRGRSKSWKGVTRQISLTRSRLKHGRKMLKKLHPGRAARRRARRDATPPGNPT